MQYPLTQPGVDLFGGKFTDGNPVGGIPASRDRAADMNLLYDEMIAVVVAAGGTPTEGVSTQVRDAILSLIKGGDYKDSVRVASVAAINLAAPGASIDGVAMVAGDRFLEKDNATLALRGIYIWNGAAVPATRSLDADTGAEFNGGAIIPVEEGATNKDTNWQITNDGVVTIGTTGLTFQQVGVSGLQAGEVSYFARNTAPTGYLKANGALISRTTYATLFAAIGTTFGVGDGATTFALPDLRGEFLRGWDDARGVDATRAFGSAQTDAFQGHYHSWLSGTSQAAGTTGTAFDTSYTPGSNSGAWVKAPSTDGTNGTPRTAAETRPRNIALLACIKY